MRNFFIRNYVAFALLIVVSFCSAGLIFAYQINRYSLKEKQEELNIVVNLATDMTKLLFGQYSFQLEQFYQLSLQQQAASNKMAILVTDTEGNIALYADGNSTIKKNQIAISPFIALQTSKNGSYQELGNLGDALLETSYTIGSSCILDHATEPIALVFVSTSAEAAVGLMKQIMKIFLAILAVTLVVTLILSSVIAGQMTKPLKAIAFASKRFAHGDFSVRVSECNNSDEIDELAISFNNMANSLEQLEELSRDFIANVSHELKTPMTSIGGFVDGMLDGTIPPENHQKYLEIISGEIKRLSRLIMRMLNASKLQSGEVTLTKAPFDLCELASRIILSFERHINSKNVQVKIDFDDRIVVNGDEDQIFQAIYNLVDNAVKFALEGGEIVLRVHRNGTKAYFSISNTGRTIPLEELSHIFDRFYKVGRSRSKEHRGAGLGLYIAKTIINLHGGDISVTSDQGVTEFSFVLPQATK